MIILEPGPTFSWPDPFLILSLSTAIVIALVLAMLFVIGLYESHRKRRLSSFMEKPLIAIATFTILSLLLSLCLFKPIKDGVIYWPIKAGHEIEIIDGVRLCPSIEEINTRSECIWKSFESEVNEKDWLYKILTNDDEEENGNKSEEKAIHKISGKPEENKFKILAVENDKNVSDKTVFKLVSVSDNSNHSNAPQYAQLYHYPDYYHDYKTIKLNSLWETFTAFKIRPLGLQDSLCVLVLAFYQLYLVVMCYRKFSVKEDDVPLETLKCDCKTLEGYDIQNAQINLPRSEHDPSCQHYKLESFFLVNNGASQSVIKPYALDSYLNGLADKSCNVTQVKMTRDQFEKLKV